MCLIFRKWNPFLWFCYFTLCLVGIYLWNIQAGLVPIPLHQVILGTRVPITKNTLFLPIFWTTWGELCCYLSLVGCFSPQPWRFHARDGETLEALRGPQCRSKIYWGLASSPISSQKFKPGKYKHVWQGHWFALPSFLCSPTWHCKYLKLFPFFFLWGRGWDCWKGMSWSRWKWFEVGVKKVCFSIRRVVYLDCIIWFHNYFPFLFLSVLKLNPQKHELGPVQTLVLQGMEMASPCRWMLR